MSILVVTGTGTDVGKTVVTAAVAALAADRRSSVAVVKPAQTGVGPDEPGDLAEVRRLSTVDDLHEYARYPDPLSPEAAARRSGLPAPTVDDVARRIRTLADQRDLVVVEGAGGLLVRFGPDGWTIADLTRLLAAPALLVVAAGLGTLNHTALSLEVMAGRGIRLSGIVVGSWPRRPDLAARANVADLAALGGRPIAGAVPEGAAASPDFLGAARTGLSPAYGGRFDAADFGAQMHGSAEDRST